MSARSQPAPEYATTRWRGVPFFAWLGTLIALSLAGLAAAHYMDDNGHWVTGMNNHVVWGAPHVFAVFLVLAASGAANVASLASVFGQRDYVPYARTSALLAMCLLAGGLAVLVLDLGRPDRLVIAMTHYNFASVFAWNVFLYTGFLAVLAVYLWFAMDRPLAARAGAWGALVFAWRIALTTGTGFIFGFLVAREAYDAAILAPLALAASLSLGTAVYLLTLLVTWTGSGRALDLALVRRLARLLAWFVLASLYLALVMHLASGYAAEHDGWQHFVLSAGGGYTTAFWIGQVLFGALVPLAVIWSPLGREAGGVALAAVLVVVGGFSQLYVIIIAGQAFPMDLVPGWEVLESGFMDGAVAPYRPTFPELVLGVGGVALAYLLFTVALRVLAMLPGRGPSAWPR